MYQVLIVLINHRFINILCRASQLPTIEFVIETDRYLSDISDIYFVRIKFIELLLSHFAFMSNGSRVLSDVLSGLYCMIRYCFDN